MAEGKRGWIPNPTGKGLPHTKKWKGKSVAIRIPEEQREILLDLARAIDRGDLSINAVAALLSGGASVADGSNNPTNSGPQFAPPRRYQPFLRSLIASLDRGGITTTQIRNLCGGPGVIPPDQVDCPPLNLTHEQLALIDQWSIKGGEIAAAMAMNMAWILTAPGVQQGFKYFKIEFDEFWEWLNSTTDFPDPPEPEPPEEYEPHEQGEGDARLTHAHNIMGQKKTLTAVEGDAIALADLVLARPHNDEQAALAKELNEALATIKRGRAAAVVKLSRQLAQSVLGWEE